MFLAKFRKEHLGHALISRRREFEMQQPVGIGVNRGVQPELLVIDLDHGFVDRDVIRLETASGL